MENAKFIYVLEAVGYGRAVLDYSPIGWDEQRVSIKRSPTFYGLFREFTTSLKFVKDGFDYIQNIYEKEGTEFVINIAIYEYQELPVDKYYLFFAGLIDLSTYLFEETTITCDINESSLARKIMSRDSVKVNLSRVTTIEGEDMDSNSEVTVNLHEREIKLTGNYIKDELIDDLTSIRGDAPHLTNGAIFPFSIEVHNIDNLNETPFGTPDTVSSVFWNTGDTTSAIKLTGQLKGEIIWNVSPFSSTLRIAIRKYHDVLLETFTEAVFFTHFTSLGAEVIPFDVDIGAFDLDFILDNILPDESVSILVYTDFSSQLFVTEFDICDLQIEQNQLFELTQAQGFLVHESMDRIINTIADKQAFKSNFLGRKDLGYVSDGEGSKYSIHSGKQISAVPNTHPSVSLSDGFRSLNSIWNLGLGIEYNEVNQPFVRVEKKAHFFNGNVIATIHNVTEIQKKVAREWIYNEIEGGYQKAELEFQNGRSEYNNKFNWTTSINTIKNKLDLVSRLRGDGYGIEKARRFQYNENPTEDTKEDNDNFIINVVEDGSNYASVRNENYDFVENIFSPESAYNLDISPGRMLRNHGSVIRAGIEKYLSSEVKFHYADQKSNMRSQRTGESVIDENEDIDPNTLDSPLWIPEIYSFKSVLTRENLAAITKNSGGIIKFSTVSEAQTTKYYYGWILSIESEENEATWELLRVNTSSPDVVLVDPEGSTPETPPIIVEPSILGGVFEGSFEFIFSG